jgi:hypothetical protein
MKYKEKFWNSVVVDESSPISDDKMSIIAEALSEVVKEYIDKKTTEEEEEDY